MLSRRKTAYMLKQIYYLMKLSQPGDNIKQLFLVLSSCGVLGSMLWSCLLILMISEESLTADTKWRGGTLRYGIQEKTMLWTSEESLTQVLRIEICP